MESEFITPEEVGLRIKVKPSTVYNWLKKGILPAFKIGGTWRINKKEFDEIINVQSEKNRNATIVIK